MKSIDIVKRKKDTEKFDPTKLYKSIHAACLSVSTPDGQSHDTAKHVTDLVIVWLDNKQTVTAQDIKQKAVEALTQLHPEASYMYNHHKTIL